MGAEVKEYAWTRISDLALSISVVMASVQPPLGLKRTFVGVSLRIRSAEWVGEQTTNSGEDYG